MNKRMCYIFSVIFIIASGILYTFERFISNLNWVGQINSHLGSSTNKPELPDVFTNLFIPLFFILGIAFMVKGHLSDK